MPFRKRLPEEFHASSRSRRLRRKLFKALVWLALAILLAAAIAAYLLLVNGWWGKMRR
jgi:fatty acid desaturase